MNIWGRIAKTNEADCWEWTGAKNAYGYGVVRRGGKTKIVTRVVWEEVHGADPGPLCVCHTCDNRGCCNPAHLWLGTKGDNLRDMTRKGRHPRGNLRLSDADAAIVRADRESTGRALAKRFGVSESLISMIRTGKHRADLFELRRMPGSRRVA